MDEKAKKINLTDLQKRDILRIFINARRNKKDDACIRREIRAKLNQYMKHYSEDDVQTIFHDCEMYMTVKGIYDSFMKKESDDRTLESTSNRNARNMYNQNGNEKFYEIAKSYIIERYFERGTAFLQEAGIIDEISERFIKTKNKNGLEREILEDMSAFFQNLTGDDLELDELKSLKRDERYEDFVKMYIRDLLTKLPHEVSREQLIQEMQEDGLSQEKIDNRLKRYDIRNRIRRDVLVSDEQAEQLLCGKLNLGTEFRDGISLAQILGEDYLYSPDGSRNIENSLVEDKLLAMYLETRSIRFV